MAGYIIFKLLKGSGRESYKEPQKRRVLKEGKIHRITG